MAQEKTNTKSRIYQATVTAAGIFLWLVSIVSLSTTYALRTQLVVLALVPLATIVGMFPITFPMPSGLKFIPEKVNFSLSDAFVLLIACWYGVFPAVFVAGIEGFIASRRGGRVLFSNLFSSGMMSLAAAAASASLSTVLRYGWNEAATGHKHTFTAVAFALLVASMMQVTTNLGLLSTLISLRHNNTIMVAWKENLLCAVPLFLPTSVAASLMYFALQYDMLVMVVITGPILVAIYFGHRQYRESVQQRINIMEQSHHDLEEAHREIIEALAVTINAKDEVTHEHVLRVQIYATGVANILGCTKAEIEALKAGALLHDIGKIAVPDYILNKPGKLTAGEFEQMKIHTLVGAQILGRVNFPYPVVPIVRSHHERWDGCGYPDGLKGEEIPLTARILTVVDCFDAVREDRQYRKGMTREEAIEYIMRGSGSQYDPRVVGAFITHLPEFEAQIRAQRNAPLPTFGIENIEQLSEAARLVAPAAGLAEETNPKTDQNKFSHEALCAFYELTQAINGGRTTDDILSAFTDKLSSLVPFDSCAITLISKATDENVIVHAAGRHSESLKGNKIALGERVTGWVLANRQPFCNTDAKLDLPPALVERFDGYRTLAVLPILKDEEIYGAVALYSAALAEYNADHQRLLKEVVALVATALSAASQVVMPQAISPTITDKDASQLMPIDESSARQLSLAALDSDLMH